VSDPRERTPPRELSGGVVRLTPLAPADGPELTRIHRTPEVSCWWDLPEAAFPLDEPESTRLTIRVDGRIGGLIQYAEELDPKYRSASIDIFVAPEVHGHGIGTEAIALVVAHLLGEGGHHRISIDPAADNHAAVRCYTKAGFTPVGVMRLAERDSDGAGWHDVLLMELVVDPVTRGRRS
jgi:aminoglycoside 6'-N-acetyltransferase